ncbi:ketol-acid reductoisomerase [Gigaspora margarita]|uniref:ketol-acid reductoisomerase (NADP(+)) n=3 Tax=Gigaspora margarita TaxID=4874 RepID=A0A8H3XDW9_GIGMA|nr:ketol-acid reductoisomerase [Gigaspora margarita]
MNSTFTFRLLSRGSKAILQQRPIITARSISILKNSRSANPVKITFNAIKPSKLNQLNQLNQVRAIQTLDFGGVKEQVHERSDWPKEKFQKLFENDTIAIIGYGPQGRGQSLNAKDNGLNVIVGLREGGRSWKLALEDGWVPGKNLFNINDALSKGTIIGNLLSDAAQKELWPQFTPHLTKGKTIYFSHGFSIVYKEETNVIPPKDIDVIMIAPKGSGRTVRSQFLDGRGINSSFAVYQDFSGKARDRCVALGIAIGSGYLYETDFKKEVYSDLFGERGVLMGAIQGLFLAQYEVLRERGHTPSEAFNETVEEATQSLYPLVGENGMDWMYAACSTTAQRGALDWYKPFHDATKPVFEKLYASVADGTETRRTLEKNSSPKYREELEEELREIRESEIWRAGKTVRSLRPEKNK